MQAAKSLKTTSSHFLNMSNFFQYQIKFANVCSLRFLATSMLLLLMYWTLRESLFFYFQIFVFLLFIRINQLIGFLLFVCIEMNTNEFSISAKPLKSWKVVVLAIFACCYHLLSRVQLTFVKSNKLY